MNKKQIKTYNLIYTKPIPSDILWEDIETMFIALGAEITEENGSRVRVKLNGIRAVFHRPHPGKITDKGGVKSIKRLLDECGIKEENMKERK